MRYVARIEQRPGAFRRPASRSPACSATSFCGNVSEEDLVGTKSSRGEHNPTVLLGFEPLPPDAEQLTALREAISSLTPEGRAELHALMRVGQGDLAAQDWDRGLDEAALLGEQAVGALLDDPDLHDHLVKALYANVEVNSNAMAVSGQYFWGVSGRDSFRS